MKKLFLAVIALFCCAFFVCAQSLTEAENSFNKGLFKQAVKEYEPFLQAKNKTERYEAQLKTILAYNNLYQYDKALQTIYSFEVPSNNLYKMRYYLLQAQLLKRTLNNYQSPDLVESQEDPTKWTAQQKEKAIKNIYQKLWAMRKQLINLPSEPEKLYLTLNTYSDINAELYPTVYDYLVEEWNNQGTLKQDKLYEESYKLEGKERAAIRELYKLKRIMLFKTKDNQLALVGCLDYIDDYSNTCSIAEVNPYLFKAAYPIAKAKALLESAEILSADKQNFNAVQRLETCLNSTPQNYFTQSCRAQKEYLTRPMFYITKNLPQDIAPNKDYKVPCQIANIDKLTGYIYKLKVEDLYKNGFYVDNKTQEALKQTNPYKTFTWYPNYTQIYENLSSAFELPTLAPGFYYIIITNGDKKQQNIFSENLYTHIINASELALLQTSYHTTNNMYQLVNKGSYAQFYALDAKTGTPIPNTKITTNLALSNVNTNKLGQAKIRISNNLYNKKALGEYKGSYALLNNMALVDKYDNDKTTYAINTDSPIYKPGEEVKIQIMGAFESNSFWQVLTNKTIEIKLISPNGKEIEKQKLTLDSFGSASAVFTLPKDAMLGTWSLSGNKISTSFSVEEYKQPEFEINFANYKGIASFNEPLSINGTAVYYRGDKVAKAKVAYIITKSYFRPWFYWWVPQRNNRETALEGITFTDELGNFKITWTPTEESDTLLPARYEVKVFITDKAGNTIEGSKTYLVSKQKNFFAIKREQGFFSTEEVNYLSVQMVNAQEEPLKGSAKGQIIKLILKDTTSDFNLENNEAFSEDKLITSFDINFNGKEPLNFKLPPLDEGIYQLKLTKDGDEGKINFLMVNVKNSKLNLPSVALVQYPQYIPGEKALVLLGNSKANTKYIDFFKQNFLIDQKVIYDKGLVILEIPIKTSYSGGIYLRWFGVADYQAYTAVANIAVIFPNTKIKATINGEDTLEPGTQANLTLTALDEEDNPIEEAKAVISVYDKALEYYKKHSLNLPFAYPSHNFGNALFRANFSPSNYGPLKVYNTSIWRGAKTLAMAKAAPQANMLMATKETQTDGLSLGESATADTAVAAGSQTAIRQDFATTAYFNPGLSINQGKANFNFQLPDILTKWQVLAALWTKNLRTGKTEFAITSTKDLFLTLQTPRFLREGDKMDLKTMVVNNTDKTLQTKVSLSIRFDNQNAESLFKLAQTQQDISLAPKEQKILTWPLEAPESIGEFTINAVARSGALVDGEEKLLALLPARQRLTQSKTIALKEGMNLLSLTDLLKDKSLQLETVQLNVEPSLIMSVLNALPLLVEQKYPTLTSKMANYYPLAVLNRLYKTYPQFKEAAAKLPKRNTPTPQWQIDENMLVNQLANSPWLSLSKGYQNQDTIDMFDANLVNKKQKEVARELKRYQNADGSLSWIQGGQGSLYMTLSYLEKAGMAKSWGVEIDETLTKKALAYATKNIRLNLAKPTNYNLNQALYLATILTSFPSDWYDYDVKTLMERTNNFITKMTPYGKANAALVWARLGNKTRANNIFASLMDSAQTSETTGIYWSPEEKSWQWFNDSINLHSSAIKALLAINPQDPRIKDLTKWLIFQKGATLWQNTEQATTAVLTIFEVMRLTSALEQSKTFDVNWDDKNITFKAEPFDTDINKCTFAVYNTKATPKVLKADIFKSTDSGLEDFASLSVLYSSKKAQQESPKGLMNITKEYYLIKDKKATLLSDGDEIEIGSEIQVRLTITCQNQFDFVSVSDVKPAAFENQDIISSWQYKNRLGYYQELKNSQTNFFFNYLPSGTYELKYTIRPTSAGLYNAGAAIIQSQFAPQYSAHSQGFYLKVK